LRKNLPVPSIYAYVSTAALSLLLFL